MPSLSFSLIFLLYPILICVWFPFRLQNVYFLFICEKYAAFDTFIKFYQRFVQKRPFAYQAKSLFCTSIYFSLSLIKIKRRSNHFCHSLFTNLQTLFVFLPPVNPSISNNPLSKTSKNMEMCRYYHYIQCFRQSALSPIEYQDRTCSELMS